MLRYQPNRDYGAHNLVPGPTLNNPTEALPMFPSFCKLSLVKLGGACVCNSPCCGRSAPRVMQGDPDPIYQCLVGRDSKRRLFLSLLLLSHLYNRRERAL